MNKISTTLLASLFVAGSVTPVMAAPDLAFKKEVSRKQCNAPQGKVVINVTQKVVNDADSGQAGNTWAYDAYNRHIQVWLQQDGNYCAMVTYDGKFDAIAGQTSPGYTVGTLSGNEDGKMNGGRRALIIGTLLGTPTWRTNGNVGTFDYGCNSVPLCPGYVSWTDQYFNTGYSYTDEWWGWEYNGPDGHTWVNSSDGNTGDVM